MRRILFIISIVLIILIQGCKVPVASFIFCPKSVEVGDTVYFQSNCLNAIAYDWDFGDGTGSTEKNPRYIYQTVGEFSVVLVVYNQNNSDKTSETITVSQSNP